jgi:putative ABC transport system permease protein
VLIALIRYAVRRLWVRKLTSFLTILGIAIGVANIIALMSISESARGQATRLIDELGANAIFVTPYFDMDSSPMDNQSSSAASFLQMKDWEALRDKPYVEAGTPMLILPAFIAYKDKRKFTTIMGTLPAMIQIRPYKLAEGRMFTDEEAQQGAAVVVLGSDVTAKLFPDGGAVGKQVVMKGEKFTVIGTFQEKGRIGFESFDDRVFSPLATIQRIFKYPYIHTIVLKHPDNMDSEEVVKLVKADLAKARGLDPKTQDEFQAFSMRQLTTTMEKTFRIFSVILLAVSSVALIVAGILIMTVMLMSVMEQTREIGVRRACGARKSDILSQFLTETLLQVVGGQVLGFIIGAGGVWILCLNVDWPFYLTLRTVVTALAFSFATGIVFGILPAYRAANLDPVDSLRYE